MSTHVMNQTHDAASPRTTPPTTGVARHIPTVLRVLMGLLFTASGFFGLLIAVGVMALPQPSSPPSPGAAAFLAGVMQSGYLFPLIKGTEMVAGALLLSRRLAAFALVLLAPVVVNIVAFHAFLAPSGLPLAVLILALEVYLAWTYRETYRPLFAAKTP